MAWWQILALVIAVNSVLAILFAWVCHLGEYEGDEMARYCSCGARLDITGMRGPAAAKAMDDYTRAHSGAGHRPCTAQECYKAQRADMGLPLADTTEEADGE